MLPRVVDRGLLFAWDETGGALRLLEQQDAQVPLRIDPRHMVSLRVIDRAGKPLPGHVVHFVVPDATGGHSHAVARAVRDLGMVHGYGYNTATTDADGIARILTPIIPASLDLSVGVSAGPGSLRIDVPVQEDRDLSQPIPVVVTGGER